MNKLIILGLGLLLFFSGCPDVDDYIADYVPDFLKSPEQRAIELADATYEGRMVSALNNSFERVQFCTVDEFISEVEDLYIEQGLGEIPPITDEDREMIRGQLEEFKACNPSIDKRATKSTEEVYVVGYYPSFTPGCALAQGSTNESMVEVEVNITSETTNVTKGAISTSDRQRTDQTLEMLESGGNCAALLTMSTATVGSTPTAVSSTPVPVS